MYSGTVATFTLLFADLCVYLKRKEKKRKEKKRKKKKRKAVN